MEWEYVMEIVQNAETRRFRHVLNWRGSEGWELVSVTARVKPVIGSVQGGDFVLVFKRPGVGTFDPKIASPPSEL